MFISRFTRLHVPIYFVYCEFRACACIPRAGEDSATAISNHYLICLLRLAVSSSGVHPTLIRPSTSLSAKLICISCCRYLMNLMTLWGERLFMSCRSWYHGRYRPFWGAGKGHTRLLVIIKPLGKSSGVKFENKTTPGDYSQEFARGKKKYTNGPLTGSSRVS